MCKPEHQPVFPFVVASRIRAPERGREPLLAAFRDRLGTVDALPDFGGLQVWDDQCHPERFVMVSWWSGEEAFRRYLSSPEHRTSHARIPTEPSRPRADGLSRYRVVAT